LRDDLSNKFGDIIELKSGDRGAFEVFVNNQVIFSKLKTGSFPEHEEIIAFIEGILNVT
jgi:selT/selW/selH-like putative selenoprotein